MEQFDAFFPKSLEEQVIHQVITSKPLEPRNATSFMWMFWTVGIVIVLLLAGYFLFSSKKNSSTLAANATKHDAIVLPSFGELKEYVPLANPKRFTATAETEAQVPPRVVQTMQSKAIQKETIEHVNKKKDIPIDQHELAKVVGSEIKTVLLTYNVAAEKTTNIVTHVVRTLLAQVDEPKMMQQQKQVKQEKKEQNTAYGGKLQITEAQLPKKMEQEPVVHESVAAGSRGGKINAETNAAVLAYMKNRGLTAKA